MVSYLQQVPYLQHLLSLQLFLPQEESAFTGVASQCLSVLVLGINTHLDACLQVSWVATRLGVVAHTKLKGGLTGTFST